MPPIESFSVQVVTSNIDNAGTDGRVFVGIGGREFRLNTKADDFEKDSNRTYIFGDGANVQRSAKNDPREPQLHTENLDKFPVYLRFEISGDSPNWNLKFVCVEVGGRNYGISFPGGLWLGNDAGKFCWLAEGRCSE